MMNKNDAQLGKDVEINETRATLGAWAVFVGLGLAVVLALLISLSLLDNKKIENWGAVVSDSLVALGVFCEIHFGRKASHGNSELRSRADGRAARLEKEAAEARERTAEIERLTAWRRISPDQQWEFIAAIRDIVASLDVLIEFERGDAEAFSYARDLGQTFSAAGVKKIRWDANSWFSPVFGLHLSATSKDDRNTISNALGNAKLTHLVDERDLSAHLPKQEVPPNVYLFVGAKPPPELIVAAIGATQGTSSASASVIATRE